MKRTSLLLIIALFTFGFMACKKDKDNEVTPSPVGGNSNAAYEVVVDGEVLIKQDGGYAHISEAVNNYNSAISVQNKFSLDINEINEVIDIIDIHNLEVGTTMQVSKYGDMLAGISIIPDMTAQKSYEVIEGTVTRTADNKLTFTATKVEFYEQGQELQTLEVEMTGYVISDVIKQIGVYEE